MRTYYIFKINSIYSYSYRNRPYRIYKLLEEVYNMKSTSLEEGYKLFEEIALFLKPSVLNEYIYYSSKNKQGYIDEGSHHIYKEGEEYTKMQIKKSTIKLTSNINYPHFFDELAGYGENLFVCDFENKDYFWLYKIAAKDLTCV